MIKVTWAAATRPADRPTVPVIPKHTIHSAASPSIPISAVGHTTDTAIIQIVQARTSTKALVVSRLALAVRLSSAEGFVVSRLSLSSSELVIGTFVAEVRFVR